MPRARELTGSAPVLPRASRPFLNANLWLRDTLVLVREFWQALLLYSAIVLAGGWLWMVLSNSVERQTVPFRKAVYTVLTLTFFQANVEFPNEWYREIFFFLMPVVGIVVLGPRVAEFAILLFNRQSRKEQWEVAVASTLRQHVIVCGLGHVGIRVVRELVALGEHNIVVVEREALGLAEHDGERDSERMPLTNRVEECRDFGIPVIPGDAVSEETLEEAGLAHSQAVIVCTNDDLINLQIALLVREQSPNTRLVVRMFGEGTTRRLAEQLGFSNVFSASALAAPFFAAAALSAEVMQTFYVGDKVMNMSRLVVGANSGLLGISLGALEDDLDLSVVLHQRGSHVDVQPDMDIVLEAHDLIVVFADQPRLSELLKSNRPAA